MKPACDIIPTVVPATFADISALKARYPDAQTLHIDAADGIFTKNTTWMPEPGMKLPDHTQITYEAHLMVEQPLSAGIAFARAGAKRIICQIESFRNADAAQDVFAMWRGAGVREIGVAILFTTSPKELIPYVELVDVVHVMTISQVGMQGRRFEPASVERVKDIRSQFPNLTISVDGGISAEQVTALRTLGVTRFCVGSALSTAKDASAFQSLQALCTSA